MESLRSNSFSFDKLRPGDEVEVQGHALNGTGVVSKVYAGDIVVLFMPKSGGEGSETTRSYGLRIMGTVRALGHGQAMDEQFAPGQFCHWDNADMLLVMEVDSRTPQLHRVTSISVTREGTVIYRKYEPLPAP